MPSIEYREVVYRQQEPYTLEHSYNAATDTLTIEGKRYSGAFFRYGLGLKTPKGQAFRIIDGPDDTVTIETIEDTRERLAHLRAIARVTAAQLAAAGEYLGEP